MFNLFKKRPPSYKEPYTLTAEETWLGYNYISFLKYAKRLPEHIIDQIDNLPEDEEAEAALAKIVANDKAWKQYKQKYLNNE